MNRIWGSSYGNDNNIKRISDRVNFRIGQTVYGKLVKKIDVNQAIIKLLNGVEFHAEVEENLDEFKQGLLKFQVKGLKDNKLQLKLFNLQNSAGKDIESDLMGFILKESLDKADLPTLEGMLKYDLSLTKDNISFIKSILQFNDKITSDPQNADDFIEKYLNSKDIPLDGPKAKEVTTMLKSFFKEFSNMRLDDVLLFIENDLDFTEETIKSYNSMFKENSTIEDTLKNIDSAVDVFKKIEINQDRNSIEYKSIIEGEASDFNEEFGSIKNNSDKNLSLPSESLEESLNKASMDIVKESNLVEVEENSINKFINNKDIEEVSDVFKKGTNEINTILKNNNVELSPKSKEIVFNIIKDIPLKNLDKSKLEDVLSTITGKTINLPEDSVEIIKSALREITLDNKQNDEKLNITDQIKVNVESKTEEAKEIIKKAITLLSTDSENISELMNTLKESMSSVKLFNKISEQYYYMDMPMKFNESEYPCKLIIKDKRKDGKDIDSKNLKLALSVKTIHFGTIDAFVKVLNRTIDIELNCDEKNMKIFDKSKDLLKNRVEEIGFFVNVNVKKREIEEFNLTSCREFFGENNIAAVDIKV